MTKPDKILASDEAWDTGQLGEDIEHAKEIKEDEAQVDEALELQLISIRLQKSLIEDFKSIAALRGVSYQPLMRQVLNRFVEAEKKQLLNERVLEMQERVRKEKETQAEARPAHPKQKKVA